MATTALKLIKKAFQKAGILTKTQNPSADEANDALDALNGMIASWSNDSLMIYARAWETFPLTGAQEYTIGPGGDFNTTRPIDIIAAYGKLGVTDYPIAVINDEAYNLAIAMKTTPGQPEWLNFDNGYPLPKIRLWPVGGASYSLFLLTEKPLSSFTDLNAVVDLPPGWERALIYNLAIEISGDYDQEVPESVAKIAVESKSMIQKAILKNHNLDCGPQMVNPNNIYTGWNR